jgi:hypothetical protein
MSTGLSRKERQLVAVTGGAPIVIHTYREAASIARIGLRTLEREIALGVGPQVIELTARRRGITDPALRAWLKNRPRKAATTQESAA